MENDNLPAVSTEAGRRMAETNVARARQAYERFAEAGETALNAFEASMAQAFEGWRAMMGSGRETAHHVTESNAAQVRKARERWEGSSARFYNAYEDGAGRALAAMREIGHRMLVASDTNVRAALDFAERLARTSDPQEIVGLQTSFAQEQSRRFTEQMVDLQQTTARLAREAAAASDADQA